MLSPAEGLQDHYLAALDLYTYEHLKLYKKSIVGLPKSDKYDLNRSNWTDFYQELEDAVSIFELKSAVFIVASRNVGHAPTEVKNIILSYPPNIKIIVDPHFETLWSDNSGSDLGHPPTANYAAGLYEASKQAVISKQRLRSKMLGLWIKNYLTTNTKRKLRAFKYAYTFNAQDYGAATLFVIVKMVCPDTRAGCLDIKYKLENINMSHFKDDTPKSNL